MNETDLSLLIIVAVIAAILYIGVSCQLYDWLWPLHVGWYLFRIPPGPHIFNLSPYVEW